LNVTKKGYILPSIIDPERVCVTLYIPNEAQHKAAFWGALNELGYWWNWETDDAHTGSPVSTVWRDVLEDAFDRFANQECAQVTFDCNDIGDCIENNPNFLLVLQQLVDNAVADVKPNADHPIDTARREDNLLSDSLDCELDSIFGVVTALVDGIHQTCVDFLEIIELITDPGEIAAELSDNAGIFTIAGTTPLDVANWLVDTIRDTYLADFTVAIRDELRCALFCNAKEGCSLSLDDIFSTYQALASVFFQQNGGFEENIATLVGIAGSSNMEIVAGFHLLVIMSLRYGSDFFDLSNFNSLGLIMQLAGNNPDPDHEILCTTCADQYWEQDTSFGAGLKDWQVQQGIYTGGRVQGISDATDSKRAFVKIQFAESQKFIGCEWFFQRVNGQGNVVDDYTQIEVRPIIGSTAGRILLNNGFPTANGSLYKCAFRSVAQGPFLCREIIFIGAVADIVGSAIYLDRIRIWGQVSPKPPNAIATQSLPQCSP
jgi:hypothetical protein